MIKRYGNFKDTAIRVWKSMIEAVTIKEIKNLANPDNYVFQKKQLEARIDSSVIVSERKQDKNNKNGGCWSFKVNDNLAQDLWNDLSLYLVTENLSSIKNDIVGLSACLKKNNFSVIKIWNKNSENNNINLLSKNILNKWGLDIIYIAHMPEIKV